MIDFFKNIFIEVVYIFMPLLFFAFTGLLMFVGYYLFGFWGMIYGLVFSIVAIGVFLKSGENQPYIPLQSICLKCGGTGNTTATDGRYRGYQCDKCHRFWKAKIR